MAQNQGLWVLGGRKGLLKFSVARRDIHCCWDISTVRLWNQSFHLPWTSTAGRNKGQVQVYFELNRRNLVIMRLVVLQFTKEFFNFYVSALGNQSYIMIHWLLLCFIFIFSFLLYLLGRYWLRKLYRFQVHNSTTLHLYTAYTPGEVSTTIYPPIPSSSSPHPLHWLWSNKILEIIKTIQATIWTWVPFFSILFG